MVSQDSLPLDYHRVGQRQDDGMVLLGTDLTYLFLKVCLFSAQMGCFWLHKIMPKAKSVFMASGSFCLFKALQQPTLMTQKCHLNKHTRNQNSTDLHI